MRILRTSDALLRLLGGASYRIAHKGPWTTGGRRDRLIGIVFWLDLAHTTARISGKWPTAVYEPKRFPPYIERREYFETFGVGTLFVEVDLVRGRVAGVTPSPPEAEHPESIGGATTIPVEPPSAVARAGGRRLAGFNFGRAVTAQSGCLACHRIGETGNKGPGPDLTQVGARLPARAIERAIVHATAPMPSFRHLPQAKLAAVVTFLSLLRE
jgi:mono/diheme cytochrome c family protein